MNILTGMHRSGTSFVANLFVKAGADFGDPQRLLAGDTYNAKGYYENIDALLLNDRLILGNWGYSESARLQPRDRSLSWSPRQLALSALKARYLIMNNPNGVNRRGAKHQHDINRLAKQLGSCWVKDPRFSLTTGLWFATGDIEKIVYVYRQPLEVAESLRKRERLPIRLGLRTWNFHVKTFLASTAGAPVLFIDFNRLQSKATVDSELARISNSVRGCDFDTFRKSYHETFERALVHHHSAELEALSGESRSLYFQLLDLHEKYHATDSH